MRLAIAFSISSLVILFPGCATKPMPMPPPAQKITKFCGKNETINCIPMDPQDGQPARGHSEDKPNKPEYQMYVPPEELWPEDFKPAPKVCASPFQGNQLLR